MLIGCHVSIAGGIDKAPQRAAELGCETMQIFTRPPQGGKAPKLTEDLIDSFKIENLKFKISDFVVHTPYYINFASANNRIRYGSVSVIRDELERGSLIGAKYVMTHLGSSKELGEEEGIKKTIEMLQKSLDGYTGTAKLLIENSAGAGAIIGDSFEEIKHIIDSVSHPALVGVCVDTQHSFASGYNWCEFEKTIERIDKELGLEKIKLFHANDSMTDFNSHRDRHEHIGQGKIGLGCFGKIVNYAKKHNINMILETEHDAVKEDIKTLKKLRDTFSK